MIITQEDKEKYKLTNITIKKFENIDLEEFKKYWETHSDDEILIHFNLSSKVYKKFCELNNIIKTKERFIYLQEKSREAKYGDKHYRNIKKAKQTKFERYGDENYHNIEQMMQTNFEKYGRKFGFDYEKSKQTCLDKFGVEAPTQLSDIRAKAHSKYYLDSIYFDSGWEVAYYIWLRDNNINFIYHPKEIEYKYNNKSCYYQPDFMVNNRLVEIKSEVLLEELQLADNTSQLYYKWQCIIANDVKIITRPEILFYINFVEVNYDKYYIRSLKVTDE